MCDINLAIGDKALHVEVVSSNESAVPNFLATIYMSCESLISQLSNDLFCIQLKSGDNLLRQNNCYRTCTFLGSIARMTSQIRPLYLIRRKG